MRKRAANKFEEQFFKDQNNSVFGKYHTLSIFYNETRNMIIIIIIIIL